MVSVPGLKFFPSLLRRTDDTRVINSHVVAHSSWMRSSHQTPLYKCKLDHFSTIGTLHSLTPITVHQAMRIMDAQQGEHMSKSDAGERRLLASGTNTDGSRFEIYVTKEGSFELVKITGPWSLSA